jgi:hypothetical protein
VSSYRVQVAFQLDTAFPRDAMTINPHYFGDNPQALGDALKTNIKANVQVGPSMPFTIKVYDAMKAPPNYPLYTTTNGTGFVATTLPREVALCLSYYATNNRPSYRGRLYIPVALIGGTIGLRPTSTQMNAVLAWKTTLGANLPSGHTWVVFSEKLQQGSNVTAVWCDDEWDTIRSRGLKSTTRVTGTVP